MSLPFQLIVITDWSRPDCVQRVKDALRAGPGIAVQHRHPFATDRQFFEEGQRLREAIGDAPLFVNGRLDVALALGANLHVTETSLTAQEVRPSLGNALVSSACHPNGRVPDTTGIDLFLVSPVFKPNSKTDDRPPLGVDRFHAFTRQVSVPCFALGGITAARVAELGSVAGVAVIGEVVHADSPARAAESLLRALRARNLSHAP